MEHLTFGTCKTVQPILFFSVDTMIAAHKHLHWLPNQIPLAKYYIRLTRSSSQGSLLKVQSTVSVGAPVVWNAAITFIKIARQIES